MAVFSKFFKAIKDSFFGKNKEKSEEKLHIPFEKPNKTLHKEDISKKNEQLNPVPDPISPDSLEANTVIEKISPGEKPKRDPYFIQIGLDFGTSYTKCVCRDIMTNKAWVHHHSVSKDTEKPFLIPSVVIFNENKLSNFGDVSNHYPSNGLYHLKNALVLAARGKLQDPAIEPYFNAVKLKDENQLPVFIACCTVYYLANVIAEIKEQIQKRYKGFGDLPNDYAAINMAIPIDNAQDRKIEKLFHNILCESWALSGLFLGQKSIHFKELIALRKDYKKNGGSHDDGCYIYPEISANVQGFIRSRVSNPGIYLFSDTGGGTIDQCVFIFNRDNDGEHLFYLSGRVLPFGSSQIEKRIAQNCGKYDCAFLEMWRERKENNEEYKEINQAKNWIAEQVEIGTKSTLALTKKKLFIKEQLNKTRVIFGGGGHCEYPYKKAVIKAFSSDIFKDKISPDIMGMPKPKDLELKENEYKWMSRLNVAYGLSFEQGDLAPYTFPKDVPDPKPGEIWDPIKYTEHAPGKDEC